MSDVLDRLANEAEQGEVPDEAPAFQDLPAGAWVLGKTCTADNGNAQPLYRRNKGTSKRTGEEYDFTQFNCGIMAMGGDKKLDPKKHRDVMVFFEASVAPWENDKGPISGRLAGFLNSIFSTGLGGDEKDRGAIRWRNTLAKLKEIEDDDPLLDGEPVAIESFTETEEDGTVKVHEGTYLTALAMVHLRKNSEYVLLKTRVNKDRHSGEVYGVNVGAVEEYTAENAKNRKVTAFEGTEDVPEPMAF